MGESWQGQGRHGRLSLDQLVDLQPGLGRLMPEVGRRTWILYYAARGGNWPLAHYQWRQISHLFRLGSTTRPNMAEKLQAYQSGAMQALEAAINDQDWEGFQGAFDRAVAQANRWHAATGHPEVRWQLPKCAPEDLDLGPAAGAAGNLDQPLIEDS
jgi:hypothetical protein